MNGNAFIALTITMTLVQLSKYIRVKSVESMASNKVDLMASVPSPSFAPLNCSVPTNIPNVFQDGIYTTATLNVDPKKCTSSSCGAPPPKPLLIASPTQKGEFPLLLFLHGYLLFNSFYSQLFRHVASHGFIVVAPQLYFEVEGDATEAIKTAAEVTNWVAHDTLSTFLPPQVHPNLSSLALVGHGHGGKSAFALALEKLPNTHTVLKFSTLIVIDPIDESGLRRQSRPPVLTYIPHGFDLERAVLVIGSGLSKFARSIWFPPCAPKGVNHENFFNECRRPAWYFVVDDYGHFDLLNDDIGGLRGVFTDNARKNGKAREPMRRFVGGAMVAFMKAYLEGDESALMGISEARLGLPVRLQRIDSNV